MKNIISKSILCTSMAILIIGCTQDSDLKIPDSEKALTLHSILSPDTNIVVFLTSTRGITTKDLIKNVKDAEVQLYEDGNLIDDLKLTPPDLDPDSGEVKCTYGLDYYPVEGREYSIKAKREGFDSIESSTRIPPKKGSISNVELVGEFENDLKNIKVTIKDSDSGDNYYHLLMYTSSKTTEIFGTDTVTYSQPERFPTYYELTNTSLGEGLGQDNRYGFLVNSNNNVGYVFDDELFNNGSIVYNTKIYLFGEFDGPNITQESIIRIELRAVNEDYFKYHRSLSLQQEARNNALAEPVFIYNNIEKGFGNFSGYNVVSSKELKFN